MTLIIQGITDLQMSRNDAYCAAAHNDADDHDPSKK